MSLNYLEIERMVNENRSFIENSIIEEVCLVQWRMGFKKTREIHDLNLGLKIVHKNQAQWLVFAFRNPWVGVFLASLEWFYPTKKNDWPKAFDHALDLRPIITGRTIKTIEATKNDRVVILNLTDGSSFKVELFPARPNWILREANEKQIAWRKKEVKAVPNSDSKQLKPGFLKISVREFADDLKNTWSERCLKYYSELRAAFLYDSLRKNLDELLEEKSTRLIRVKNENRKAFEESKKAEQIKTYGDALLGSKHLLNEKKLTKNIEVEWCEKLLQIPLDPKLSISENAKKYYDRYKKLKRSEKELSIRNEAIDKEIQNSRQLSLKFIQLRKRPNEDYEAAIDKLEYFKKHELGLPQAVLKQPKKIEKKIESAGVRRFLSKEGLIILVGRSHKENEQLVIRIAKGNDFWLHLKGKPSAHVVVQVPKGKSASLESLLDAATLVAHFSGVEAQDKVEVDYTMCKFVKRVSGGKKAGTFLVTYSQNKTLIVKADRDRLNRLFMSSQDKV